MASHQQLLYHIIFSVRERRPLLQNDELRASVWAYMAGVASRLDGFALKIGGYVDHGHLLVRIPTKISVAKFVGGIKSNSSKHINEQKLTSLKFHWQDGYGAFTVSSSRKDSVIAYIEKQVHHPPKVSFKDEYLGFLERHDVSYDPDYLWE